MNDLIISQKVGLGDIPTVDATPNAGRSPVTGETGGVLVVDVTSDENSHDFAPDAFFNAQVASLTDPDAEMKIAVASAEEAPLLVESLDALLSEGLQALLSKKTMLLQKNDPGYQPSASEGAIDASSSDSDEWEIVSPSDNLIENGWEDEVVTEIEETVSQYRAIMKGYHNLASEMLSKTLPLTEDILRKANSVVVETNKKDCHSDYVVFANEDKQSSIGYVAEAKRILKEAVKSLKEAVTDAKDNDTAVQYRVMQGTVTSNQNKLEQLRQNQVDLIQKMNTLKEGCESHLRLISGYYDLFDIKQDSTAKKQDAKQILTNIIILTHDDITKDPAIDELRKIDSGHSRDCNFTAKEISDISVKAKQVVLSIQQDIKSKIDSTTYILGQLKEKSNRTPEVDELIVEAKEFNKGANDAFDKVNEFLQCKQLEEFSDFTHYISKAQNEAKFAEQRAKQAEAMLIDDAILL